MKYEIIYKPIAYNNPGTPIVPVGGVVHETANPGDTAQTEWNYFNGGDRKASAHAFVDSNQIVQCISWTNKAWHAGPTANANRIGIELCHTDDPARFAEIWKRATWLWAYLLVNVIKQPCTPETLMSHADTSNRWHETDHQDPISYFARFGKTMDDFRRDVQREMEEMQKLDWKGIIEKVASKPADWENAINTAVAAAKADGDLGALEIFKFLPELIEKVYNS